MVEDFIATEEVKKIYLECVMSFQVPNLIEIVPELSKYGLGKIIRRNLNV